MEYFSTRYEALKAYPNGIIRKVLNYHVNARAGQYAVLMITALTKTGNDAGTLNSMIE